MEREEMPLITTTYQAKRLQAHSASRPRHAETGDPDGIPHTLFERSIALRLTWRF
jgi:hypothetical protein